MGQTGPMSPEDLRAHMERQWASMVADYWESYRNRNRCRYKGSNDSRIRNLPTLRGEGFARARAVMESVLSEQA